MYPLDTDFSNNRGQHNVEIARSRSPVVFPAQVFNTTDATVHVEIAAQCSNGECQGWAFSAEDNGFELPPNACPRTLDFVLEPVSPNAPRQIRIDWAVNGFTQQGDPVQMGGFSTTGVIGCATSGLAFVDDGSSPPKSRIVWSPDAVFAACPGVFDVVRGALPVHPYPGTPARGDFSKAVCVADDVAGTAFVDPATPNPDRGFYYLVRAGGALAGTLDGTAGSQVGSRDDTFAGCP